MARKKRTNNNHTGANLGFEETLWAAADKLRGHMDASEYTAFNVFWLSRKARWKSLQDKAKNPKIGKYLDDTVIAIEKENPSLKGVLPKDYARIAGTYHAWRGEKKAGKYQDIPGFCKSAEIKEIRDHDYVLTPGRYVGAEEIEDDGEPFEEKMIRLVAQLSEQFAESARLEKEIKKNLKGLGYGG